MLRRPLNPNQRPNSDVIFPYMVGDDLTGRSLDRFIVDFGLRSEEESSLYEAPFAYVLPVKLHRAEMTQEEALATWWLHWRYRKEMRTSLAPLSRFIVTPRVAKFRTFLWTARPVVPDNAVVAIARNDDTTFGILHSRFHELWSLRMGTSLEDRPRYTPTTCFETFPFPEGLTPNIPAAQYANDPRAKAIAKAAATLNERREAWLNPPDLVKRVPEVVPGYPDRILPVDDTAAAILKTRTLTKLYNERPTWLDHAHRELDAAVAAAYGWPSDLTDDQILEKLFALNQQRAAEQ
jgi:type II restriction/modification system DNA methylase subunit YeeA